MRKFNKLLDEGKKTIERSLEGKQNACVYVFFKSVENRWKVMLLKNAQSKGIENALHVSSDFVHNPQLYSLSLPSFPTFRFLFGVSIILTDCNTVPVCVESQEPHSQAPMNA